MDSKWIYFTRKWLHWQDYEFEQTVFCYIMVACHTPLRGLLSPFYSEERLTHQVQPQSSTLFLELVASQLIELWVSKRLCFRWTNVANIITYIGVTWGEIHFYFLSTLWKFKAVIIVKTSAMDDHTANYCPCFFIIQMDSI